MIPPFDYFEHRRACQAKQLQRTTRIANLSPYYHAAFSLQDRQLLDKSVEQLVQDVHSGGVQPLDILKCYGKAAVKAHAKTNCLTEVMISKAEKWSEEANTDGPLAGIPISLKDSIQVGGFDVSVGYSRNTGSPAVEDGTMVKILRDAGAIPYVKTALPITLLSFESTNDIWGRCVNPHNPKYSPGGSTGGEGALLAAGGGRIGIGSDVAGSVRAPAHFCGIYSLRCSTGRWPKMGMSTSMPGQEGVPSVFSPMARTLQDLRYFTRSMISMKPWEYDHSVHSIEWRATEEDAVQSKPKLSVGVLWSDGIIDPSPACRRALNMVVDTLRKAGHEVVDINPPSIYEGFVIASTLLNADGGETFSSFFRTGEWCDLGAAQLRFFMRIPRPLRYLYSLWVRYIRRDPLWAELLEKVSAKSAFQQYQWVAKREAYRARWHKWWQQDAKVDFIVTPPNATPAVPHGGMKDAVSSCSYTFIFNLLDYTCGIVPVTHVDQTIDDLDVDFNLKTLNGIAQGAYMHYDAKQMDGLPVGVQVVGRRLQEERVLEYMGIVEHALASSQFQYKGLEIE